MANGFSLRLIEEGTLRATHDGFEFGIRLPWYRSLPLSTVEISRLEVDGVAIEASALRLRLNDVNHAVTELADLTQEWWYVLDSAWLPVQYHASASDTRHELALSLTLYPPYIPGLAWVTQAKKTLHVSE